MDPTIYFTFHHEAPHTMSTACDICGRAHTGESYVSLSHAAQRLKENELSCLDATCARHLRPSILKRITNFIIRSYN